MKKYLDVLKQAAKDWSDDNCLRLGAALAYYTMTSLFPLLLIVVAVVGFFSVSEAGSQIQNDLINRILAATGNASAAPNDPLRLALEQGITGATEKTARGGVLGTIIGFALALFAASGVFGELDASFNVIWDVPKDKQPTGIVAFIKTKFLSFTLVLGVAFLLLVSTVLSTVLSTVQDNLPLGPLWTVINFAVQIAVIAFVFALLFKYLPDTEVQWSDVWPGAFFTAVLWVLGQLLLAFYFANVDGSSAYGIIGGVLALLLYIYYSSQILFFGGEVTQAYANLAGSRSHVTDATPAKPTISPQAAVMVSTALAAGTAHRKEDQAAARTRQAAAAATGGIIGLLGGAVIGGVGLVIGVGSALSKLRKR